MRCDEIRSAPVVAKASVFCRNVDLNGLREQRCGRDLSGGIRFKQHRRGSPYSGE
jgi:hypothetical protein